MYASGTWFHGSRGSLRATPAFFFFFFSGVRVHETCIRARRLKWVILAVHSKGTMTETDTNDIRTCAFHIVHLFIVFWLSPRHVGVLRARCACFRHVACNKVGSDPSDHSGTMAPTHVTLVHDVKRWTLASPCSLSHVLRSKVLGAVKVSAWFLKLCLLVMTGGHLRSRVDEFVQRSHRAQKLRWFKASAGPGRARFTWSEPLRDHSFSSAGFGPRRVV